MAKKLTVAGILEHVRRSERDIVEVYLRDNGFAGLSNSEETCICDRYNIGACGEFGYYCKTVTTDEYRKIERIMNGEEDTDDVGAD